jgi:hypothetical protein
MHMILDPTDDQRLAIEMRKDAAEITMQLFAQRLVAEERAAFLGREDEMKQNLRERLRHGARVGGSTD